MHLTIINLLNVSRVNSVGQLRHCGSYLGRDYKVLLQVLPVILVSNFSDSTTRIAIIVPCFAKLVCTIEDHKGYTAKPKERFLTHIAEDIRRFGTALNFETEKVNVSKQLATKFGKQSVMRHIIDGGSWLDEEKKRVQTGDQVLSLIQEHSDKFLP
ncbi:hypothetical protein EDC96DRAFT_550697 [Choanephora cucurbitarum]|nr:hypothetical protein EDC96DRAFT_550697 [Choanephora cucurbitarum]